MSLGVTDLPRARSFYEAMGWAGAHQPDDEVAEWGGTSGAFSDPDGYVWEIAHNPGWTLTAAGCVQI